MKWLLRGALLMPIAFLACDRDSDLPPGYRGVEVPAARLESAASRERGRRLFLEHCALCHGVRADGRGVRREGLSSAPRDFTDLNWRRRYSPRRIFFSIREGVRGTPMPSWKALDEGDTWDMVTFILSVSPERR